MKLKFHAVRAYKRHRNKSALCFRLQNYGQLRSQIHAPATLSVGKYIPVRIGYETGWDPKRVWTWLRKGNTYKPARNRTAAVVSPYWLSYSVSYTILHCIHLDIYTCQAKYKFFVLACIHTHFPVFTYQRNENIGGYLLFRLPISKCFMQEWYKSGSMIYKP